MQRPDVRLFEECQLLPPMFQPLRLGSAIRSSSRVRIRCRNSVAAASVNVTIKNSVSDVPSSTNRRHRSTSVRVFPAPAPAITSTFPRALIACSWAFVNTMTETECLSFDAPATSPMTFNFLRT